MAKFSIGSIIRNTNPMKEEYFFLVLGTPSLVQKNYHLLGLILGEPEEENAEDANIFKINERSFRERINEKNYNFINRIRLDPKDLDLNPVDLIKKYKYNLRNYLRVIL